MTTQGATGGFGARTVARLAGDLRQLVSQGKFLPGAFMPTERELSTQHAMAKMTTRRALKLLESEGLITAVPRQGYRVLGRAGDPNKGAPLAYVVASMSAEAGAKGLMEWIQRAAARRHWGVLTISGEGRTAGELMEQLRAAHVSGVILGVIDREFYRMVGEAGIPAIADDAWPDDVDIDVVTQDGFHGGMVSTAWLLSRGHRRIAFFGPDVAGSRPQVVERYSGCIGTLAQTGLTPACIVRVADEREAEQKAVELLSRADRPTGIVAPWRHVAAGVLRAVRRLNLTLGKDLDMVGWCTRERFPSDWIEALAGGPVPPAAVWSVEEAARTTIARLEQRRSNPKLPTIHLRIPVRLCFPGSGSLP